MNKQFNTELRKKKARSSQLVVTSSVAYCKKTPPKNLFFKVRRNMIERCTNKQKMKNQKYRKL